MLFDLDGTIWDSLPGIVACLAHALEVVGVPVPDESALAANIGPPLVVMLAHFGVPEERLDDARIAYRDRYRRLGEFECTVYPGASELLTVLHDAGLRLATATSKGVEPTLRMLDHFGLASLLRRGERRIDGFVGPPQGRRDRRCAATGWVRRKRST